MKALILAAGFGTRLERDLKSVTGEPYAHLIGVPKPLLPVGGKPLASHWLQSISEVEAVESVLVVTNGLNHSAFEEWAKIWPDVQLICDGATSNEGRTGAVGCMNLAVKHLKPEEDLLVIAGDTLFYEDFSLKDAIQRFRHFKEVDSEASMVVYVTCTDEEVHKYGILETDDCEKVVGFLEKPQPTQTSSRKEDEEMKKKDAPGNFINYLHKRKPIFAREISGRFDVGGLASYIVCNEHFLKAAKVAPQSHLK